MTLATTISRNTYLGNSSTATYNYSFRIFLNSDLAVFVRDADNIETPLLLGTDYTVAGVGDLLGGSISLVDVGQSYLDVNGFLATGFTLAIRRVVELTQETDIRNQGDFFPEVHEDEFDKLTMIDQQQQDEIDRSLKLPESIDPADFDTKFPAELVGAMGAAIITNPTGDGFTRGPTADEIANAQNNAVAAAASAAAALVSQNSASASAASAATSASNAATSASQAAASAVIAQGFAFTYYDAIVGVTPYSTHATIALALAAGAKQILVVSPIVSSSNILINQNDVIITFKSGASITKGMGATRGIIIGASRVKVYDLRVIGFNGMGDFGVEFNASASNSLLANTFFNTSATVLENASAINNTIYGSVEEV